MLAVILTVSGFWYVYPRKCVPLLLALSIVWPLARVWPAIDRVGAYGLWLLTLLAVVMGLRVYGRTRTH